MTSGTRHYLPAGLPAPEPTKLDRGYWEAAGRHELAIQQCPACGNVQFPPEEICIACHAYDPGWVVVPARGTLESWTRIWHPVHPALIGFGPYLVAVVALDGYPGIRLEGNLLGDVMADPAMDAAVEAVFEDHDGFTLIQWMLVH
ncbi:MAG: Zn-ribbon domain-containing OB-fold protein [Dehalococcoidia bacterium]